MQLVLELADGTVNNLSLMNRLIGDGYTVSFVQPCFHIVGPWPDGNPFAEKLVFSPEAVPVAGIGFFDGFPDLESERFGNFFIGIAPEYPITPRLFDGQPALRGKSRPLVRDHTCAVAAGDRGRVVVTQRIDNDNFVGELEAFETPLHNRLGVLRN
jgi:hypothetical protein